MPMKFYCIEKGQNELRSHVHPTTYAIHLSSQSIYSVKERGRACDIRQIIFDSSTMSHFIPQLLLIPLTTTIKECFVDSRIKKAG